MHPGPGTGHEIGVMFAFIVVMVILTISYFTMWKIGNKKGEEGERQRRQALQEKMAGTRDEKVIAEHDNSKDGDKDSVKGF